MDDKTTPVKGTNIDIEEEIKVGDRIRFTPSKNRAAMGYTMVEGVVIDASPVFLSDTGSIRYRIRTDELSPTDGKPLEWNVYSNQEDFGNVSKLQSREVKEGPRPQDQAAIDYGAILTPAVERHMRASVLAAQYEGNNNTRIDADSIVSRFTDHMSPAQYKAFDQKKAENILFSRLAEVEKELGLKAGPAREELTKARTVDRKQDHGVER